MFATGLCQLKILHKWFKRSKAGVITVKCSGCKCRFGLCSCICKMEICTSCTVVVFFFY